MISLRIDALFLLELSNNYTGPVRRCIPPALPVRTMENPRPGTNLLFITHTGVPKVSSRERTAVRSHVMRKYRSKDKMNKRKPVEENQEMDDRQVERQMPLAPEIAKILGAGRIDPFDCFSVSMNNAMNFLFDHCEFHLMLCSRHAWIL